MLTVIVSCDGCNGIMGEDEGFVIDVSPRAAHKIGDPARTYREVCEKCYTQFTAHFKDFNVKADGRPRGNYRSV